MTAQHVSHDRHGRQRLSGHNPHVPSRVWAILRAVASDHAVTVSDLMRGASGRGLARKRALAVHDAMTRLREMEWGGRQPSMARIGRWLGNRDHTTVSHGLRRWKEINELV